MKTKVEPNLQNHSLMHQQSNKKKKKKRHTTYQA